MCNEDFVKLDEIGRVKLKKFIPDNCQYFEINIEGKKIILNKVDSIKISDCNVETIIKDGKVVEKFIWQPEKYIRRVDELGRIVLPVEFRKEIGIKEGEDLRIEVQNDNKIVLEKWDGN